MGRIDIGLLGLTMERERQRIVCGKSMDRCFEEGVIGSCRGKGEAEDRSVGSCHGKEEVENRAIGSCRGKEEVENRVVGSCCGKGEAEDRLWQIGGLVL